MSIKTFFNISIGLLLLVSYSFAANLKSVEIKKNENTALYFKFDKEVIYKAFTLNNPKRVVIDFNQSNLTFNLNTIKKNGIIKQIRSGAPQPHTLRLVFEVIDSVNLENYKKGLLTSTNNQVKLTLTTHDPLATNLSKTIKKPYVATPIIHPPKNHSRDIIIVLDAGHGGKDPGAIGPRRSAEKNVTLAIAYKLKQLIDKQQGMRAILTRTGDYYVGLRERLSIARKNNADIFISIHADAFINKESNGASVFALSQRGATSEAARWLAEKENYSELGGVNLKGLDDQSGLVRTVLIDLSQTATIGASLHMGDQVLKNLSRMTTLHNHQVEQARFMVLKSPDIPSILIETGFISNPREERNLNSTSYQAKLTNSIFQGLKTYFWEYPPHGTYIESILAKNLTHIVQSGDSLQKLANEYNVTLVALQTSNQLKSTNLQIGQKLIIPTVKV